MKCETIKKEIFRKTFNLSEFEVDEAMLDKVKDQPGCKKLLNEGYKIINYIIHYTLDDKQRVSDANVEVKFEREVKE